MTSSLLNHAKSRENNFNLIRFIAASLVLYDHSFALSGNSEPLSGLLGMSFGVFAVDIFFVISGFLIACSFLSRKSWISFIWSRVLRIYPALVVATLFCVFIVGLWFTTINATEYLLSAQTYKFIIKNITLFYNVEYKLPGVFLDVPHKNAVNGSLWTLPYEVWMYVIIALLLGFASYINKKINFFSTKYIMLFVCVLSFSLHMLSHSNDFLQMEFTRLFYMFMIGSTFFVYKDRIQLSLRWALLCFILLISSRLLDEGLFDVTYFFCIPYLVFYLAYIPSGIIRNFNKRGDYSYGLYIYAFPVQQSIVSLIPNISASAMIVMSAFITLLLAMCSWHLVEKQFLKMKGSYVVLEDFLRKNYLKNRLTKKI